MEMIKDFSERLQLGLDFENSKTFQASLKDVMSRSDPLIQSALSALLVMPMKLAIYISAHSVRSKAWWHYGLSIPYYTHFTSPIRRYADVIVHRLLNEGLRTTTAAAELNTKDKLDEMAALALHCNKMRESSRAVQLRCDRIYMSIYLSSYPEDLEGVVIGIGNKSFSVLVPKYGLYERIFVDDIDGYSAEFSEALHALQFNRVAGSQPSSIVNSSSELNNSQEVDYFTIRLMSRVKVRLTIKQHPPIDIKMNLLGPL